ncbi:MAG TPA: RDD family protein [Vicinamibacteria bacterium]|nr:RDD family protein [Vicinamibacteria bacterium]
MAGLRKPKEPTWKDEVRDRVQKRRRRKQEAGELPLFDAPTKEASQQPGLAAAPEPAPEPEVAPAFESGPAPLSGPALLGDDAPSAEIRLAPRMELGGEAAQGEPDLPLRPPELEQTLEEDAPRMHIDAPPERGEEPEDEWVPPAEPGPLRPVERPAALGDRLEAAVVDAGVLFALGAIVVYFAGRAAQTELAVLLQHWPWLFGFLAFLGLSYAGWFTGTTGQTPGKMMVGLRVVETAGRPPGYPRAFLRAALGALGTALLGLGIVPLFFDPARRALHDRLLRTRVVKF